MWTSQHQQAFEKLKSIIKEEVQLQHLDFPQPFLLCIDASNLGIGAILLQHDSHGIWAPICFISRSLTKAETNYSTTEKELLAIVWALQKLHAYVHGTDVTVETDHQLLVTMMSKQHPPGCLLWWILVLQDYTFQI